MMKREKQNKKDEQLSQEIVIKSVRYVRNGEGDYSGKNLWKRSALSLEWEAESRQCCVSSQYLEF